MNAVTRLDPQTSSADPFASFGFHSGPPAGTALPPIPKETVSGRRPAPRADDAEPALAPPPRSRRGLVIGGVVLLGALAVLLHPVEAMVELPGELQAEELGVPRAPRAGAVGPAEVASGTRVEKGAVLARMPVAADETPEALDARIKELEKKLAANRPASAKDLARAQAAVKKATAAVAALTKQKKKATRKKLAAIEKQLEPKQKALDAATAALAAMQQGESADDQKRALEQLTSKKVAAAIASERSVIGAPVAGIFIAPEAAPAKLAENDAYGRIIAPAYKVVTKEPLLTNADTGVFKAPGIQAEVKLKHEAQGNSATVEGPLKWVGAKGTIEVTSGRTAWILSLLH